MHASLWFGCEVVEVNECRAKLKLDQVDAELAAGVVGERIEEAEDTAGGVAEDELAVAAAAADARAARAADGYELAKALFAPAKTLRYVSGRAILNGGPTRPLQRLPRTTTQGPRSSASVWIVAKEPRAQGQ